MINTDTDSLVYDIRHHDIYEWIGQHREYLDLSDSKRPNMQDDTNRRYQANSRMRLTALLLRNS